MKIHSAKFVMSNSSVEQCPSQPLPEYAFIGRSNVGKSSLINALTNHSSLAKTSSRPGKTQLINHFIINENWFLVDLPGYGYARVSKSTKKEFQSYIRSYFKKRTQLFCAFVLIDIRHKPQPIDLEFMEWLANNEIAFYMVFTKADKLKPGAIRAKVDAYCKEMTDSLWETHPPYFITSSTTQEGCDEILQEIDRLNRELRGNL